MRGARSRWQRAMGTLGVGAVLLACGSRTQLAPGRPASAAGGAGSTAGAGAGAGVGVGPGAGGGAAVAGTGSTLTPPLAAPNCAVSITGQGLRYCGVYQDGSVWCWGQGGPSNFEPASAPRKEPIDGVTRLVLGPSHACAIRESGELWCWGDNESGQIDASKKTPLPPTRIELILEDGKLQDVAVGATSTCAALLETSSEVYCWGTDATGASSALRQIAFSRASARWTFSDGETDVLDEAGSVLALGDWSAPQRLSFFGKNNAWSGGTVPACVLKRSGSLWCTDYLEDAVDTVLLAKLSLGESVVQAGTGDLFMCALTADGKVWCEGLNEVGQTGRGFDSTFEVGAFVPGLVDVSTISVATHSACALKTDGSVWCWGLYAADTSADLPVQVSGCVSQSAKPRPAPPLGSTSVPERLKEASRARAQSACACSSGTPMPKPECIEGEDAAPDPDCLTALAPSGELYWTCTADSLWQKAACNASSCADGVLMPCPDQVFCGPGKLLLATESYCRRRACASDLERGLSRAQVCDGVNDCADLSDERNCTANTNAFECDPETRLPPWQLCDGKADCRDASDEQFCP